MGRRGGSDRPLRCGTSGGSDHHGDARSPRMGAASAGKHLGIAFTSDECTGLADQATSLSSKSVGKTGSFHYKDGANKFAAETTRSRPSPTPVSLICWKESPRRRTLCLCRREFIRWAFQYNDLWGKKPA